MNQVLTKRHGKVLEITLNRPDRLNAATPAMFEELTAVLADLQGAGSVLLTGAGKAFCSGADLSMLDLANDPGQSAYEALTKSYNPVLFAIAALGVPIVSAVGGAAAGIGCSLALAADFCIAGESAYFLQAFTKIGLVPDGGASWTLPRLIGKARAAEMMMLGDRVSAGKALEWGLISQVVDNDALDDAALMLSKRLAERPELACQTLRHQLRASHLEEYASALAQEAEDQRSMARTADAGEGIRAFMEKRAAVFTGR